MGGLFEMLSVQRVEKGFPAGVFAFLGQTVSRLG
jgi:hypothetical protein